MAGEGLLLPLMGLVFMLSIVLIGLTVTWFFRRSNTILNRWAEANTYEVLEQKVQWFNQGPFFWRSSSGQTVYRVKIRNRQDGCIYHGWVRCGSFWLGLFSDQVDVLWDA